MTYEVLDLKSVIIFKVSGNNLRYKKVFCFQNNYIKQIYFFKIIFIIKIFINLKTSKL